MNYEQLRATIIGRMQTFSGIAQARIDYQNPLVRFEPSASGLWCRLTTETARPVTQGLCEPMARIPGNIIIQCFDRAISQTPTVALVRLADALAEHFQYWEAPGLQCREAQLINAGQPGEFTQANVQIYFLTI